MGTDRSGRVAVIGGGPAGLFLARMIGLCRPGTDIEVYERKRADDIFGFGVALSERTMHGIAAADPHTHQRIVAGGTTLSGVELRLPDDVLRYGGFSLFTISRDILLAILREHAEQVGARLHFSREVTADALDADIIAFADGAGSTHRAALRTEFGTSIHTGSARYIWLGTAAAFDDVATFAFVRTEYGPMAVHAYPYGEGMSTVVVETDDTTWCNAGLDSALLPSGVSGEIDGDALKQLSEIFADHLGGQPLVSRNSKWGTFDVVHNERWSHGNAVLLGDAAHTAHFTVGSGTKMALEDGIALAHALGENPDHAAAFQAYEQRRRGPVARVQNLAEPSMRWWETFGRRLHLPPAQFGMHFVTRTAALSYLGLRRRCADRVDDAEAAYYREAGVGPGRVPSNAVAAPLRLGEVRLPNRLVTVQAEADAPAPVAGVAPIRGGLVLRDARTHGSRSARPPVTPIAKERMGSVFGTLRQADWEPPGGPVAARSAGNPPMGVDAPWLMELLCPGEPEWDPIADDLVTWAGRLRERGISGVVLRANPGAESWWEATLRYASRIRTEARVAVAVYVPGDWALDLARDPAVDTWPARIHMGLISGRIDLVVASPLTASELGWAADSGTGS